MSEEEKKKIASKTLRRQQYKKDEGFREYQVTQKAMLMTTRFNDNTWLENTHYRKTHSKYGCIYPSPEPTNQLLDKNTLLFVIEMNNDANTIVGIGMVKNTALIKKHSVYSNENYNRYCYIGKYRIDRADMTEEEGRIFQDLDNMCFKGAKHMKRLRGIKMFPIDRLYQYKCDNKVDLMEYITKMFHSRMTN